MTPHSKLTSDVIVKSKIIERKKRMKRKNGVNYVTISNPKDPYLDYAFIDSDDSISEAVFDLRDISVETVRVFSNPCISSL